MLLEVLRANGLESAESDVQRDIGDFGSGGAAPPESPA